MSKISLFTPCFNEEGNIEELYRRVTEVMASLPEYDYEYILIDNHSEDRTRELLRKIASDDKRVKLIFNLRNYGPSRSGSYGFFQTSGDASICLAADLQDPPELIPEFIKKWKEGYKVVWGQKTETDEEFIMRLFRKLYYRIVKRMADSPQYENVTGFGLYDKSVVQIMKETNDPTPNFRNLIGEYGYDIGFVRYHQPRRKKGKSSYSFLRYLNVAITSVVTTSQMPLRIATMFGVILAVISFAVGLVYLILKLLFWNSFYIGLAPIVIGVFFLGAVQLAFIGVLGEYIGELLRRQSNVPMVIEEERINFGDGSE